MRKTLSILLLFVCAVLIVSIYQSAHRGAVETLSASEPISRRGIMNVAAITDRAGLGEGDFWWSNYPAGEICEHGSYPAYDPIARQLLLRRGTDFVYVFETNVDLSDGFSVAPGCRYIAGVTVSTQGELDRRTLVIWDVASGQRVAELPDSAGESAPLVIWSPDGESALLRTSTAHFLWNGGDSGALILHAAQIAAIKDYPAAYWDYARGQLLVDGQDGVLAFDLRTGAEVD